METPVSNGQTTNPAVANLPNKRISDNVIQKYLYGYKEMRLVSSEEVLSTLLKGQIRKCTSLPETPPLSPRKIRTPDEISLCSSSLPGSKFGACAIKRIQQGTWFGPFEGKLVRTTEISSSMNTDHMWEIFHDGEVSHFLDGFNENNWMAFVRCARHKKEQNLVVFQYHGCIYYRSTKDILPGNELLVWYDTKYTQLLGIPLTWNDNRGTTSKRKNSLSICTDDPSTQQPQQTRRKREKVTPLSLLQQIDYKTQPPRKNELEFLASLIAKNAPSTLSTNYENSPFLSRKDLPVPPSTIRCDKCYFSFPNKELLITHKCSAIPWIPPPPPSNLRGGPPIEKHHPLHRPIHVNTPYAPGIDFTPASALNPHYHSYYQNLAHAYPSPPMEPPIKNFGPYKSSILPLKNF